MKKFANALAPIMILVGGFILATGCELISPDAFPHAKRMVEIAKTYGVYKK